ncbi:flavin reductase family protein [Alishewanella sp. 16-MA]|uniref:Flavin reductase family protein n=1 Tax=Alishewanella maricola TaxID=2795740 RepID=A0ABS8C4U8_9ALTE|nr:flavin reductase family protein [Alishewanella maricola]MCB5227344.1 flavin reductase family protein [Alishewanella maricola]
MADYFFEPQQGHGLAHDPFNSIIAPRPIGWISSISNAGQVNLAPYSFFNLFNYKPPIIGFASTGWKDSVQNIAEQGEFCWNLVNRPLVEAMNQTSASVAADVNEFTLAGLTMVASKLIKPPQVAESPVRFECKLSQLIPLQAANGEQVPTWLVLGEVVGVHIASSLLIDGVYDTLAADPVLRAGGPGDYYTLNAANKFSLLRPKI